MAASERRERGREIAEETRRLLVERDIFTPTYFPLSAMIEMQRHVGYKPKSNPRPRHKQLPFAPTEIPREIGNEVYTPSWFRYANMDGATLPDGYHWDVDYYRREDGNLTTQPALAEVPTDPAEEVTSKLKMTDFVRAVDVAAEITNEGIEDISSDEETYTRGNQLSTYEEESDESSTEDDDASPVVPARPLLATSLQSARARSISTTSSDLSEVEDMVSPESVTPVRPQTHGLRQSLDQSLPTLAKDNLAKDARIDSQHGSAIADSQDEGDSSESDSINTQESEYLRRGTTARAARPVINSSSTNGSVDEGENTDEDDEEIHDGLGVEHPARRRIRRRNARPVINSSSTSASDGELEADDDSDEDMSTEEDNDSEDTDDYEPDSSEE